MPGQEQASRLVGACPRRCQGRAQAGDVEHPPAGGDQPPLGPGRRRRRQNTVTPSTPGRVEPSIRSPVRGAAG